MCDGDIHVGAATTLDHPVTVENSVSTMTIGSRANDTVSRINSWIAVPGMQGLTGTASTRILGELNPSNKKSLA